MSELEFCNENVAVSSLPEFQAQSLTPLHQHYYQANFVIRLCVTALLLVIAAGVKFQPFFTIEPGLDKLLLVLLIAITSIGSLSIIYGYFSDRAKGYAIRDLDITFASGVIFKKLVTQPLLRLQHIELKRGPVERKVGLATIQVFSAGGAMYTFELPGLTLEEATNLRQFILDHKDVSLHE